MTEPRTSHRTRRGPVLAAMMLAMFMSAVEATIVATAMPTIVAELGGFSLFSWVFAIFLLTQAVTIPVYGKLADMRGRKPVFYVGTTIFLVGSLLCGFAHTMIQLVVLRAVQGVGAGAVQPIATTIVGDIYTPAERARIQGWLSSVWGISSVIGPALGAFFAEKLSWSLVFWINLPIGIASMLMLAAYLHEDVEHHKHQVDYLGSVLLMVSTTLWMLALIQYDELSRHGGYALPALVVLGAVGLVAFFFHERRAAEPLIPLSLWKERVIAVGNSGALITGALMMGITSFLPTYVQGVMARSAMVAGFTLATMSIGWPLASVVAGRLMLRTSYRFTAITGGIALVAGAGLLTLLSPQHGALFAATASFVTGAGMGLTSTVFIVSIQTAVPWKQRGAATSSNMFSRIVGQAVGTALFGAVLNVGISARAGNAALSSGSLDLLMDPIKRRTLAPDRLHELSNAMAGALHNVYVIGGVLAVLTFFVVLALPLQLRPEGD